MYKVWLLVFCMYGFDVSGGDFVVFVSSGLVWHGENLSKVVSFPSLGFTEVSEVEGPPS